MKFLRSLYVYWPVLRFASTAVPGWVVEGPSVCHFKASKELGYVPRPFIETLRDTYAWFDDNA